MNDSVTLNEPFTMDETSSTSITVFFLKHKLPNKVEICFNSNEKDEDSWVIYPIEEGRTSYHYYIPLQESINGYDRIVVSSRSADYLKQFPERINKLRIRFFPWPEVVLPYRDNQESFEEQDSIDYVMTRYKCVNGILYDKVSLPSYSRLLFEGFKRNDEFEKTSRRVKEAYFYDPDNLY